MEEANTQNQPQEPQKQQQVVIHKNGNATLVGAIIFLALVIGAAAIYIGMQKASPQTAVVPTPSIAQETSATVTPQPTQALEENDWENYTSTKMKDLSFPAYSISYPFEWKQTSKRDDITDTFTLTNGSYSIKIYQAPMGGGMCIFSGDLPDGPASDYRNSKFVDIAVGQITIRRIETATGFVFCSNSVNNPNDFGSPTGFGAISYTTPVKADPAIITEMDKIIATLKIIN